MTEIVAEISGNHGGSIENALKLIIEAKRVGADAVKFQCFDPERLAVKRSGISWQGITMAYTDLLALYCRTETPREWFPHLIDRAELIGIPWFSSVFDPYDVAFLEALDCPCYKISQYEDGDWQLLKAVVETGKPYIRSVKPRPGLTILIATEYAGPQYTLGISDHSNKTTIPRDCPMVERHLRLPDVDTPDKEFSSTPEEFAAYVTAIRKATS